MICLMRVVSTSNETVTERHCMEVALILEWSKVVDFVDDWKKIRD